MEQPNAEQASRYVPAGTNVYDFTHIGLFVTHWLPQVIAEYDAKLLSYIAKA